MNFDAPPIEDAAAIAALMELPSSPAKPTGTTPPGSAFSSPQRNDSFFINSPFLRSPFGKSPGKVGDLKSPDFKSPGKDFPKDAFGTFSGSPSRNPLARNLPATTGSPFKWFAENSLSPLIKPSPGNRRSPASQSQSNYADFPLGAWGSGAASPFGSPGLKGNITSSSADSLDAIKARVNHFCQRLDFSKDQEDCDADCTTPRTRNISMKLGELGIDGLSSDQFNAINDQLRTPINKVRPVNVDQVNPKAQHSTKSNSSKKGSVSGNSSSTKGSRSKGIAKRPANVAMMNMTMPMGMNAPMNGRPTSAAGASHVFTTPTPAARRISQAQRASLISPPVLAGTTPAANPANRRNPCNCKKSRCLKLYCECFAGGNYCEGCNCVNCSNNRASEPARQEAVEATLERNPNAFRAKIQAAAAAAGKQDANYSHSTGCHCKKSACLKKYCECFQAGIHCCDNCKCSNCRNFPGSAELAAAETKNKRGRGRTPAVTTTVMGAQQQLQQLPQVNEIVPVVEKHCAKRLKNEKGVASPRHESEVVMAPAMRGTGEELGEEVLMDGVFGHENANMKKGLCISVLHFLDNDDLYNQSLVSKDFCKLSLDGALWDYPKENLTM